MRACVALAALLMAASKVTGHPICFVDDKPPDVERSLTFCPAAQDGACCTELEEAEVEIRYNRFQLTGDCANLYKEVECGQCHSYSGHLFAILGAEYGIADGMMMTNGFCNELVSACEGQIDFPEYDGETYCEKHTGGSGNADFFWSYPYTQPEIFEPGLNKVFELEDETFPEWFFNMKMTPDGSQWWILGQFGQIKSVNVDDLGSATDIVDLADLGYIKWDSDNKEEGLLDLAFGPLFGQSGYPNYFYTSYTCDLNDGENGRNRLSRFTYIADDPSGTLATQDILLTTKPKYNTVHSAGWVGFKPSDYGNAASSHDIYWTTGDGGPQSDTTNQAQDSSNMLGAMMRITVPSGAGTGYTSPSGNLVGGMEEICANGFRNPYKCSFDKETDVLYCGDVGQDSVEEINIIECGNNYGWAQFEGSRCQEANQGLEGFSTCQDIDRSGVTFPWFEYCHYNYYSDAAEQAEFNGGVDICGARQLTGLAAIGGYVYRGEYFADLLYGAYIFADYENSNVYFIKEEEGETVLGTIVSDGSVRVIGFAEDNNGEIIFITEGRQAYHMPCGDLCASTCLEQAVELPTITSEGCFVDSSSNRALSNAADTCDYGEKLMSHAICASHCTVKYPNSVYAGVEYGYECFCGDENADFDKNGELPPTSCNYLCTANPDEFCGGKNVIEVFKIGAPEVIDEVESPVNPINSTDPIDDSEFTSVGCFVDNDDSRSMLLKSMSNAMTPELCARLCSGFPFFGTQYGEECWCGKEDAQAVFESNGAGSCTTSCAGNSTEICGGFDAMSVYSSEGPTIVLEYEPVGCYADPEDNRSMEKIMNLDDMTAAVCAGLCTDSPFFGTQYGFQCWCGDDSSASVLSANGLATCDTNCVGDSSETCGGSYALSVYSRGDTIDEIVNVTYTSVGCYADPKDNRSMVKEADSGDMTAALCDTLCPDSPFFGTQYGKECWCGDDTSASVLSANGMTTCDDNCAGDASEKCGDSDALSVYSRGDTIDGIAVNTYTSVGCYADFQDNRSMSKEAESTVMTAALCATLCSGFPFFGTQYGKECWCGGDDAEAIFEANGAGSCTYNCAGETSEICGGFDAISVYSV